LKKLNREYIAPRAAAGSVDGHALADARVRPRRLHGHHAAGRRPSGDAHKHHVGSFIAFNTYMIMLTGPIIAVGWVINLFQRGTASIKRIDEISSRAGHRRQPCG
jgi:ABC-type multidrug transport system fused ATPase/permease subunit